MNKDNILKIVNEVTAYAETNDFSGYCKHDGLNSPILNALSFDNKWLRLIFIQGMMRFPVNLRPLLLTEKSRNPKGVAIFAKAFLMLYQVTKEDRFKQLAESLLSWLMENHSNKDGRYHGYCWGYNFIWQSPFFHAPKYAPNLTVSVFPGEAFILGYNILGNPKYLDFAKGVAEFVLTDLPILLETETEKCLGYVPSEVSEKVININTMAAAFLAKVFAVTKCDSYKQNAIKLVTFVVNNAIDNNRWTYTTDIKHSYVDNYHTGGILDEILETMENLDHWTWKQTLVNGLAYYKERLFASNGAPRNRDNMEYPHDIHGSAQGIITFSRMSRTDPTQVQFAEHILDWTMRNMYSGNGYFYYQQMSFYTKKFTFMRWCNSWMLYALAELLYAKQHQMIGLQHAGK